MGAAIAGLPVTLALVKTQWEILSKETKRLKSIHLFRGVVMKCKINRRQSFCIFMAIMLGSCGGGNGSTPPVPPRANNPPVVSAGADQVSTAQKAVEFNATASDPDNDPMNYEWVQTMGSIITLNNSTSLNANFEAPDVSNTEVLQFQFKATDDKGGQGTDDILITVNPLPQGSECTPSSVPQSLRSAPYQLADFYQKYCDANGIPVLGSSVVRNEALIAAHERIISMSTLLDGRVRDAMVNLQIRVGVMAQTEVTTDIPEHSDLYQAFPGTDWDSRARGLGATPERPASTGAEENLLCLTGDVYQGEDIFVHEYAHSIHIMGLSPADSTFDQRLENTFDAAIQAGLWNNTYAATNVFEYWAEGVQSWFNVNQEPQVGIHNDVNTRQELLNYDPDLHNLIAEYFPTDYRPSCP